MRASSLTLLSLLSLAAALIVCGMAVFLAFDISNRLAERASSLSSGQAQSVQAASAVRTHALAEDTASERASLNTLLDTDILGIANTLDGTGKAAGAQTSIGTASAVDLKGAPSGVQDLEFVVVSSGTFSEVMHAAELFETLPLPSAVEELDFETNPDPTAQKSAPWQLTARIRVLTDADVSS